MKRKNSFFDITEEMELQDIQAEPSAAVSENEASHAGPKKQIIVISLISIILITAFLLIRNYAYSNNITNSAYYPKEWLTPAVRDDSPTFEFCEPNWNSDILNDKEYIELKLAIMYSPNGSESFSVDEDTYFSAGGAELEFIASYINAVINGEHETINAMYSEDYLKSHSLHSAFPQQRLYNIKIRKYHYSDPQYKNSYTKDSYYIISYKINQNDGLFRNDVGQDSEIPQLFEILTYADGTIKIDNIISLPGYYN